MGSMPPGMQGPPSLPQVTPPTPPTFGPPAPQQATPLHQDISAARDQFGMPQATPAQMAQLEALNTGQTPATQAPVVEPAADLVTGGSVPAGQVVNAPTGETMPVSQADMRMPVDARNLDTAAPTPPPTQQPPQQLNAAPALLGQDPNVPITEIGQRILDSATRHANILQQGKFRLSGDQNVPGQGLTHSQLVNNAITDVLKNIGGNPQSQADIAALHASFLEYRGVSLDRQGNFLGTKAGRRRITDEQFILGIREMQSNWEANGNPYDYTNPTYDDIGNTLSFPMPMSPEPARLWSSKISPQDLKAMTRADFADKVLPQIHANADIGQMHSLLDLENGIAFLNQQPSVGGRNIQDQVLARELADADSKIAQAYSSQPALRDFVKGLTDNVAQSVARQQARKDRDAPLSTTDAQGNPEGVLANMARRGLRMFTRNDNPIWLTTAAIGTTLGVARIGTLISSGAYAAVMNPWITMDATIGRMVSQAKHGKSPVQEEFFTELSRPENIDMVIETLNNISRQGGIDRTRAQASEGRIFGEGQRIFSPIPERDRNVVGVARTVMDRSNMLMSGSQFARGTRVRNTFRILDSMVADAEARGDMIAIPRSQWTHAIKTNNRDFFEQMFQSNAYMDAAAAAAEGNLTAPSVGQQAMLELTRNSMAADMATTALFGRFLPFIPVMMRPLAPITMLLELNAAYIFDGVPQHAWKSWRARSRGEQEPQDPGQRWRDYAGGTRGASYGQRMKETTIAMFKMYGRTRLAMLIPLLAFANMLGLEEPDDPEKRHLWYEWKIGGVAYRESWFAQPNFADAGGMVVAAHLMAQGNFDDAWLVMNHTWQMMVSANQVQRIPGMIEFWSSGEEAFMRAQEIHGDELDEAEFYTGRAFNEISGRLMTVWDFHGYNEIADFMRATTGDNIERSTRRVYADGDEDSTSTEPIGPTEAGHRRNVYNRPFWGMVSNIIQGLTNPEATTGFLRSQMPMQVTPEQWHLAWRDDFSVFDNDGNDLPSKDDDGNWIAPEDGGWPLEDRERIANDVYALIKENDPQWLRENYVMIPYHARVATSSFINEMWWTVENEFQHRNIYEWDSRRNPDLTFQEARQMSDMGRAIRDTEHARLEGLLERLWSNEIPFSPDFMPGWETEMRSRFVYTDTGETAGQIAWILSHLPGGREVEQIWYRGGNHRNALMPWQAVSEYDTYDFQTPLFRAGELTDPEFMEAQSDRFGPMTSGRREGEMLWDVSTGEGRVGDGPLVSGVGQRALLPPRNLNDPTDGGRGNFRRPRQMTPNIGETAPTIGSGNPMGQPINWNEYRGNLEPAENTGGGSRFPRGGGGRRGGGGGGSAPNIFSRPANSLNVNTPRGLSSSTPRSARFDYLRPNFQTKGSRTAWTRGDI